MYPAAIVLMSELVCHQHTYSMSKRVRRVQRKDDSYLSGNANHRSDEPKGKVFSRMTEFANCGRKRARGYVHLNKWRYDRPAGIPSR